MSTTTLRDYVIEARFMQENAGWRCNVTRVVDATLEQAWEQASRIARSLDRDYSDSHFWTVDLKNAAGGSYVQLFHGRLS